MSIAEPPIAYVPTVGVRRMVEAPVVRATRKSLEGYGRLVDDPASFPIEIVRWPARNWRPVDTNSGDQGGVTQGRFDIAWRGEVLFARNHAVGSSYLFGWSTWPEEARGEGAAGPRERALIWRANYHPDGGQLVFPLAGESFVVPLALPGDDVTPESFVAFRVEGGRGLYIHPNIWHGPFIPYADQAAFHDRQGRVHARVSVDFAKEFGCYLSVPLS
ncbi:MAG TPA: ureidoglycolate lyase [Caulobacteraceae bacterium]|jgi:hypothetical protein|nr:ureidoglycolate lyase [Caulobacteraceae bacterium]